MDAQNKMTSATIDGVKDLRNTLDWLRAEGDLIETNKEINPDLELVGIQKHLDGSCPILFENVKDKPNHRVITNLFGDINVINKMFGWSDDTDRTRKLAAAFSSPITPEEIDSKDAPVHQHVIEKPNEVNEYMVPIRHTEYEPELTVGSGIRCVSGEHFGGGGPQAFDRFRMCLLLGAAVERRLRVVLYEQLDLARRGFAVEFSGNSECEVDPRRYTGSRDDVAVDHHTFVCGHRTEMAQQVERHPMAGCPLAPQQTCSTEQQRPCAYGGDELCARRHAT